MMRLFFFYRIARTTQLLYVLPGILSPVASVYIYVLTD